MSGGRRSGDDRSDDRDHSDEGEETVETAGEGLSRAGFEPSRRPRRIVPQGKPRERLRRCVVGNEKSEGENNDETGS